MKRFLIQVGLFLLLIFIFDIIIGRTFSYLVDHAHAGDNRRNNYICNETNQDVLIFGSSRAIHHYNPLILSDSLNLTCYNCGQDGNGAILHYGRYQLICQRYQPQILIYDVTPDFDFLEGDNHTFLTWLKAYYDRNGIPEVLESVDSTEKYKMYSYMYRYNSSIIQTVLDFINSYYDESMLGFRPSNHEMDTLKISKDPIQKETYKYDSLKIGYIEKMVEMSETTKFIFVVSPIWYGADTLQYTPIKDICKRKSLTFLDYSNDPRYVHNSYYFSDGVHLNARGADEFTRNLVQDLKKRNLLN